MSILDYWSGKKVSGGQPHRWTAGMASNHSYGERGVKADQRRAQKRQNQLRNRAAHRG